MTTCSLRLQARKLHNAWRAATPAAKPAIQLELKAVMAELEPRNMARAARFEAVMTLQEARAAFGLDRPVTKPLDCHPGMAAILNRPQTPNLNPTR